MAITATSPRARGSVFEVMEDGRPQAEVGTEMAFRILQTPTAADREDGRLKVRNLRAPEGRKA